MSLRRVQKGTTHSLSFQDDLTESGKGGAVSVSSAQMTVGATVTDLSEVDLSYDVAEAVGLQSSGHSTQVTATPVYSAGGGPGSENVWTVSVVDSSGFTVGDVVTTRDQVHPGGYTYEVVDLPNGTEVTLHSSSSYMDISDGDTLVEVDGTGVYVSNISFPVDTYITPQEPIGSMIIVLRTVAETADPGFATPSLITKVFNFELDQTGQLFRTI